MENDLFLEDSLNNFPSSITFARLKILHSSLLLLDELVTELQVISQNLIKTFYHYQSNSQMQLNIQKLLSQKLFKPSRTLLCLENHFDCTTALHSTSPESRFTIIELHYTLSINQKYNARNDDFLIYISIMDLSTCYRLTPQRKFCTELCTYPIDSIAACEVQLLKNFKNVLENCQSSEVVSEGYNVQKVNVNT